MESAPVEQTDPLERMRRIRMRMSEFKPQHGNENHPGRMECPGVADRPSPQAFCDWQQFSNFNQAV